MADRFPSVGTGLQRYAARFSAVEINSTFYRRHRPSTFERWRAATPPDFRFAVKLPRAITHDARLVDAQGLVMLFRTDVEPLGPKLGPLLVQLPPRLVFDETVAGRFFGELRALWPGPIVCEPRHHSWFEAEADALMKDHHIGRVAADPARHPSAATPGGWGGIAYWRLHGSPRMYYSAYDDAALAALAAQIAAIPRTDEVWCIFDNTTSGAAATNALDLQGLLGGLSDPAAGSGVRHP